MVQQLTKDFGSFSALWQVSDVAAILGVSAKTVNKLVRDEKLSWVQVTSRNQRFFGVFVIGHGVPPRLRKLNSIWEGRYHE